MEIGIAGLPQAGKTTLFNALAHQHAQVGGYTGAEPNLAVVKVPDERLDRLSELFQPRKHTPAEVRFVDVAGVAKGMGQESAAAVLAHLRTVDVLLVVVGAYAAGRSPASDLEEFELELQLADLGQIEKRLERLEKELRLGSKGTPAERAMREREMAVLQRLRPVLEEGRPARTVELSRDELARNCQLRLSDVEADARGRQPGRRPGRRDGPRRARAARRRGRAHGRARGTRAARDGAGRAVARRRGRVQRGARRGREPARRGDSLRLFAGATDVVLHRPATTSAAPGPSSPAPTPRTPPAQSTPTSPAASSAPK